MAEARRSEPGKIVSLEFGGRQSNVRIHLLGAVRATNALGDNLVPRGRKARAILGYLCLHAGQRVPRSRLASLLWDRVPEQQARTSLRQALRELSHAMGPTAEELLRTDYDTVKLDAHSCWIDALAVVRPESPSGSSFRSDLASVCSGELLEDLNGLSPAFDQWLLAERSRFASQVMQLLESELYQLCQSDAEVERRAAIARRVLSFDATHEGASRILMRALADMGERAQALKEFERCRTALRTALDVEPSSETRALCQALKTFSGNSSSMPGKAAQQNDVLAASAPASPGQSSEAPVPARLRIGILPFQGDGSPRVQGIAFSLSQEIAAALARFRWFDVIAPVSPRIEYSDAKNHGTHQGNHWDYVVDGALSSDSHTIQVSIRLLDVGQEARPVWSDRLELTEDALSQMHERVVSPVVARIDPVIQFIEGQQRTPQRLGATALVLRAIPLIYSLEKKKYDEAFRLIQQALEVDPNNAKVAAWAAFWHVWYTGQGWAEDPAQGLATAQELSLSAIRLDPESAEALGVYAHICAFLDKDFDSAVHYFERALQLNPNLAFIWAMSAPTYCYIGQHDRALLHLERYRELAPFDPHYQFWESTYTIVYTFKGDYERAARVGRRAVKANPGFSNGYKPLIAALGHLGQHGEAAQYISKILLLEPNFTVEQFGKTYPFQREEDRRRYMHGLALAGVPLA